MALTKVKRNWIFSWSRCESQDKVLKVWKTSGTGKKFLDLILL